MAWMNGKGLAMVAGEWGEDLEPAIKNGSPAGPELAVAYTLALDWKKLKTLAKAGAWGSSEFMRHAFLARAERETGAPEEGVTEWSAAIQLAEQAPARLAVLEKLATSWGWRPETEDLLWLIAGSAENPRDALSALSERYAARGDTHQLYRVWTRVLEIDPNDETAKNNWASLSLLLGLDTGRATQIASELNERNPTEPHFAATYALAMYLQGRTADGLATMRRLTDEQLKAPGAAAYYGILLAAEGGNDAAKFIKLGKTGALLPEEQKLLEDASEPSQGDTTAMQTTNFLFHRPPLCDRRSMTEEAAPHAFTDRPFQQELPALVNLFRARSPAPKKREK